jgi:hypothetical protein
MQCAIWAHDESLSDDDGVCVMIMGRPVVVMRRDVMIMLMSGQMKKGVDVSRSMVEPFWPVPISAPPWVDCLHSALPPLRQLRWMTVRNSVRFGSLSASSLQQPQQENDPQLLTYCTQMLSVRRRQYFPTIQGQYLCFERFVEGLGGRGRVAGLAQTLPTSWAPTVGSPSLMTMTMVGDFPRQSSQLISRLWTWPWNVYIALVHAWSP